MSSKFTASDIEYYAWIVINRIFEDYKKAGYEIKNADELKEKIRNCIDMCESSNSEVTESAKANTLPFCEMALKLVDRYPFASLKRISKEKAATDSDEMVR